MKKLAVLMLLAAACDAPTAAPKGEVILYFDTDAPLPPGHATTLTPNDAAPLFDTLRVEVFEPGATAPCPACTREFAVDADLLGSLRGSVGIPIPPGVAGYRVRAQLFPNAWKQPCSSLTRNHAPGVCVSATDQETQPHPNTTISAIVSLPVIGDVGLVARTVFLATDTVGTPQGTLDAPLDTAAGAPTKSAVGTWPPALRVDCTTPRQDGEACIPGGAFWRGNPQVSAWSGYVITPHLVVLSPFWLQSAGVSVGECRANPGCAAVARKQAPLLPGYCIYTPNAGTPDAEKLPVNCVSWGAARSYCMARGGDLPSMSEWEYAAGGLHGSLYVWGDDEPTCADAMFGRNANHFFLGDDVCNPTHQVALEGPFPPGRGARDQLTLSDGSTVYDLNGNLSSYARDAGDPCEWPSGVLFDPVCVASTPAASVHGGSWADVGASLSASRVSGSAALGQVLGFVGFRCARPGQ